MVFLGLLLLAASLGAAVSIAVNNTAAAPFDVFGWTVTSLSPGGLMLLGIALGVAGLAGLLLMRSGMVRGRRRRLATRHDEAESRSRVQELEAENIRLRQAAAVVYPSEPADDVTGTDARANVAEQVSGSSQQEDRVFGRDS